MSAAKRPETPSMFQQIEYRAVGDEFKTSFTNAARQLFLDIIHVSNEDRLVSIETHDGGEYQGLLRFDTEHDEVTLLRGAVRITVDIDDIVWVKA